jgi:outer membrane immunogenic protein
VLSRVGAILIVVLICASHAIGALAQSPIGSASSIQNRVEGIIGDGTQTIAAGGSVFQNERVRTGEMSQAQFVFLDRTNLGVGPKSEVTLNEFVYNPNRGSGKIVIEAGRGVFRFVTGSQNPRNYEIKTPIATIGVRGTEFQLLVESDFIVLALVRGAVRVVTTAGRVVVLNRVGTAITIRANGQVEGPTPWTGPFTTFAGDVPFPFFPSNFAAVSPPREGTATARVSPPGGARTAAVSPPQRRAATALISPPGGGSPPVPVTAADWTGWFVGLSGGVGTGKSLQTDSGIPCIFLGNCPIPQNFDGSYRMGGGIFGGGVGYNFWQNGPLVLGIVGDVSVSNASGSAICAVGSPVPHPCGAELQLLATARGLFGYEVINNWLLYGTGGYAGGELRAWDAFAGGSGTKFLSGWSTGAGLATLLTQNLSLKLEYLYVNLGHRGVFDVVPGVAETVSFSGNVFRAGVDWKFDSYTPPRTRQLYVGELPIPYNWSGLYVGGNVGYHWANTPTNINELGFPATSVLVPPIPGGGFSDANRLNGTIGGGQFGYNFQFGRWVLGFESDWQAVTSKTANAMNSSSFNAMNGVWASSVAVTEQYQTNIDWSGTARGRFGFVANGGLLFYGTAGLAYGRVNVSGTHNYNACLLLFLGGCVTGQVGNVSTFGSSKTNLGWAAGAGVEGPLPNLRRWTWKFEYLHTDIGSLDTTTVVPALGGVATTQTHFYDDIIRVGLNYKFLETAAWH